MTLLTIHLSHFQFRTFYLLRLVRRKMNKLDLVYSLCILKTVWPYPNILLDLSFHLCEVIRWNPVFTFLCGRKYLPFKLISSLQYILIFNTTTEKVTLISVLNSIKTNLKTQYNILICWCLDVKEDWEAVLAWHSLHIQCAYMKHNF